MLVLDGKPLVLRPMRPSIAIIIKCLKRQPANKVFDGYELCEKAKLNRSVLRANGFVNDANLQPYTIAYLGKRYWGNPKAIIRFKKQVANED